MRTRIKVCCIASPQEARMAIECGADAVGLVSAMPSGPGVISEEMIAETAAGVPPPIGTFLLTSEVEADTIIAQQRRCRTNTIQLVDAVRAEVRQRLHDALQGVKIVQVIHVAGERSLDDALEAAKSADALLLDSGNPALQVKELGGTGRTHDWRLSREIVLRVGVPVFLAGGLNPANVRDAIHAVQPFGVDLCSGVRTEGKLNLEKVRAFVTAVQTA